MSTLILALKSLYNRRVTALLTLSAIALSVTLLLGVERIRQGARESFSNTISKTDLIVGARSGPVQLLLYSVFRIGDATNNISWKSYRELASRPEVAWTVPISLGDSHHGFRVMGTNQDYFKYYRYSRERSLELAEGAVFENVFDAVLGADVAREMGYRPGQKIVLTHGIGEVGFLNHEDKPFQVVGILEKTGTPVDRTIHVSLEGIEAMHVDWQSGAPPVSGEEISVDQVLRMKLEPKNITAFLVGVKSKILTFRLQRDINEYREEPLLAILPGVALQQLWSLVGMAETALRTISAFVVLIGLFGMLTNILTSLNERRREMAILRSVGARPIHIFVLLVSEAGLLCVLGCLLGVLLLYLLLLLVLPLIEQRMGFFIPLSLLSLYDVAILCLVTGSGLLMGGIPAWRAYRQSLIDGLTIRL
ncbi:MAG: ABC transporter permease [SAR324 cluster bacterium]|nr:ABC transporter permease [SAR324 cluster bacterium]